MNITGCEDVGAGVLNCMDTPRAGAPPCRDRTQVDVGLRGARAVAVRGRQPGNPTHLSSAVRRLLAQTWRGEGIWISSVVPRYPRITTLPTRPPCTRCLKGTKHTAIGPRATRIGGIKSFPDSLAPFPAQTGPGCRRGTAPRFSRKRSPSFCRGGRYPYSHSVYTYSIRTVQYGCRSNLQ